MSGQITFKKFREKFDSRVTSRAESKEVNFKAKEALAIPKQFEIFYIPFGLRWIRFPRLQRNVCQVCRVRKKVGGRRSWIISWSSYTQEGWRMRWQMSTKKAKKREFKFSLLFFPVCFVSTCEIPFRKHCGGLIVFLVADLAGIRIPHTLHPSSHTSPVNIAHGSGTVARWWYQALIRRVTNPTACLLIRIIVIIALEPEIWHFF